ncbi:MAG TPA: DUF6531 domain-containing protein [Parachlamydiaceae bacterium]|nr:DUF6531 domain-containing protein [Parachlamydiaceae bacterium]
MRKTLPKPLFQFLIASFVFIYVCSLHHLQAFTIENIVDAPKEMLLNEPSSFVNQSVNVITGNYHENEIDLEVAGPHPLFFQRSYASNLSDGTLTYQWNTNHFGCIRYHEQGLNVAEDYGICVSYDRSRAKKASCLQHCEWRCLPKICY